MINKGQIKYLNEIVLAILGFCTTCICIFLYLGDDFVKRTIVENAVAIIVLIFGLILVAIGIACFRFSEQETFCIEHDGLFIMHKKAIVVIGKENARNNISYYEDCEIAFSEIKEGDTIYLFGGDFCLNGTLFAKLSKMKNLTVKFMGTNCKIYTSNEIQPDDKTVKNNKGE